MSIPTNYYAKYIKYRTKYLQMKQYESALPELVLYHGSIIDDIKMLDPKEYKDTQGKVEKKTIFATPYYWMAIVFSYRHHVLNKYRRGLSHYFRFGVDNNKKSFIEEKIKGAFEDIFIETTYVYVVDPTYFKPMNTKGSRYTIEYISESPVKIIKKIVVSDGKKELRSEVGDNIILKKTDYNRKDIIFIAGKAGSGKSYIAKKFEAQGYILVSMDEVIRNTIIPKFTKEIKNELKGEVWRIFRIYREGNYGPIINKIQQVFAREIRHKIRAERKKGNKVVVEGSLWNNKVIREIFGIDHEFTFYFMKPKSEDIYIERLKDRFEEDPNNYGRLGFIKGSDKGGEALNDYKKNGINGDIIKRLLEEVGKKEYKRVKEWYDHYNKEFDIKIYVN